MAAVATAVAPGPLAHWKTELNTVLIGQAATTEALLIALLAGGHVLLEGPPGVGKRVVARALAGSFGAGFAQVPCVPAPAVSALYLRTGASNAGRVVLVSGLEHASLTAQAALQEALHAAEADALDALSQQQAPLMLIASRNPSEASGAVALHETLLDLFTLAIAVPFPSQDDETRVVRDLALSSATDMLAFAAPQPLFSAQEVAALQARRRVTKVDEQLMSYAVRIVRATRFNTHLSHGAGPRAAIALVRCAQARALLYGRDYALPEDVKQCATPVLRHRVRLAPTQRVEGAALDEVLAELINQVSAPRP
jgi:MoxR-like ATPase